MPAALETPSREAIPVIVSEPPSMPSKALCLGVDRVWIGASGRPLPRRLRAGSCQDTVEGKALVQCYGLQDYGSFLGLGGYFGMDYTDYTFHILAETARGVDAEDLRAALEPEFIQQGGGAIAVVSDVFAEGYRRALDFYTRFRGEIAETRLAPLDLTPDEARKIIAFFTWGAMMAIKGYTNGFPYYPGLVEPTISSFKATWVTISLLLLAVMPLIGYVLLKFIDYWRDQRVSVGLPPPSRAQRLALVGMALAALGFAVQGATRRLHDAPLRRAEPLRRRPHRDTALQRGPRAPLQPSGTIG